MLILSRKSHESLLIGEDIEVTILDIQGDKIRIGISAPSNVSIVRKEIKETAEANQTASEQVNKEKLKTLNQLIKNSNK
ncbi:MAG: carbon storage regulator, CsrA [Oscillospiraceae bacterium]|nr:carbon storage regulator, CsrA [Oscillospiraceae bacterium]